MGALCNLVFRHLLLPQQPVVAYPEPVRLVPRVLQHLERGRGARKADGLGAVRMVDFLELLCKRNAGDGKLQLGKFRFNSLLS